MNLTIFSTKNLKLFISLYLTLLINSIGIAQYTLGLDRPNSKVKRIHFMQGDPIRVQQVDKTFIQGTIDAIYDSSFVIEGRKVLLKDVYKVFTQRPFFHFAGNAFTTFGIVYGSVDIVNNLIGHKEYVISQNTPYIAGSFIAGGLIIRYLGTRRTLVYKKNNFRSYNLSIVPILNTSNTDTSIYCKQGVEVLVTHFKMDGCTWLLILPNGKKLEPVNIYDYLTEKDISSQKSFKARVEFYETKTTSICMIGKTVAISCLERINRKE